MADKKNEITAQSLLGRLKGQDNSSETEQNKEKKAAPKIPSVPLKAKPEEKLEEAAAEEVAFVPDFGDEFVDHAEETKETLFDVVEETAVEDQQPTIEEYFADFNDEEEELVAPDFALFDEIESESSDKVFASEAEDDEIQMFGELDSPDNGYEGVDYSEYAEEVEENTVSALDRIEALEVAETSDDFDNDPLEVEEDPEAQQPEEEAEEVEYDEAADFENLVSEVMGEETEELSESDISLMVALGMEDELAKSVGEEDAVQMTDDFLADQQEWVDRAHNYGPDEYTDMSQNRKIAIEYTNKDKWGIIRLVAAAVLTILVFFYENLPVFGYQFEGFLDPARYPVVYIMMGLQLLFFMIAVAFPAVVDGAKNLFSMKLLPSSIAFITATAAVLCNIHAAFNIQVDVEPRLFNLPAVICLFMAIANDYFTNKREIFSFNIVSSKNPKYVMRRLNNKDSQLENQAVADLSDETSGDIVKIAKTDFVEGYFWRTHNRGTVDKPFVALLLILCGVLSLIVGLYVLFTHRLGSAVETAFVTLMTALPAASVMVGFYPFYRANKEAYYNDCTIIGEGSVEEYSDTEVISFDDVNVFPSVNVKVRNVRLYNNCRIDKVLYYASSVFSATGGPLADVFEVATIEMGHSEDVSIVETGSGFIEATVNGKSILFAKEEALLSRGITIPENVLISDDEDISPDTSVMYMIYQGRLVSKMILSYVVDADFEYIIRQLADSGMYVCVKTFDPNIDEALINGQVVGNNYPLRVIKYKGTEEITKYSDRTDGGIISRGTTKALLQTISYCDRIVGAKKTGYVLSIIAAIFSVLVVCAAVVMNKTADVYSVYPAVLQLFWIIPAFISTRIIVR
ncbi:MAG: hypothetical protein IJ389_00025 [Clostridia bacterium]|nr:hypothetical protein [Clostridia bacterium]